jgi:hypothetical protein
LVVIVPIDENPYPGSVAFVVLAEGLPVDTRRSPWQFLDGTTKSAPARAYRLSGAEFVGAWPLDVPGPAPIVSPVVPLFIAPLLTPAPGLERLVPFDPPPAGLTVAGDTAESPDGVAEPVLAFCASASELVKTTADTAMIDANLMSNSLVSAGPTFACRRHGHKSEQASGGKVPGRERSARA